MCEAEIQEWNDPIRVRDVSPIVQYLVARGQPFAGVGGDVLLVIRHDKYAHNAHNVSDQSDHADKPVDEQPGRVMCRVIHVQQKWSESV